MTDSERKRMVELCIAIVSQKIDHQQQTRGSLNAQSLKQSISDSLRRNFGIEG
jgi:hypothetical protein